MSRGLVSSLTTLIVVDASRRERFTNQFAGNVESVRNNNCRLSKNGTLIARCELMAKWRDTNVSDFYPLTLYIFEACLRQSNLRGGLRQSDDALFRRAPTNDDVLEIRRQHGQMVVEELDYAENLWNACTAGSL